MGSLRYRGDRPGSAVTRLYTIWPADREGVPATSSGAWHQDRHWLVLDITDGMDQATIVEGPVSHETALQRELELSATIRVTFFEGKEVP